MSPHYIPSAGHKMTTRISLFKWLFLWSVISVLPILVHCTNDSTTVSPEDRCKEPCPDNYGCPPDHCFRCNNGFTETPSNFTPPIVEPSTSPTEALPSEETSTTFPSTLVSDDTNATESGASTFHTESTANTAHSTGPSNSSGNTTKGGRQFKREVVICKPQGTPGTNNVGLIIGVVGGAVGGAVLIGIVIVLVVVCVRKRNRKPEPVSAPPTVAELDNMERRESTRPLVTELTNYENIAFKDSELGTKIERKHDSVLRYTPDPVRKLGGAEPQRNPPPGPIDLGVIVSPDPQPSTRRRQGGHQPPTAAAAAANSDFPRDPSYVNLNVLKEARGASAQPSDQLSAGAAYTAESEIDQPIYTNVPDKEEPAKKPSTKPKPQIPNKPPGGGKKDYENEDVINDIARSHRDLNKDAAMTVPASADEPTGNYMSMAGEPEPEEYYNVEQFNYNNPGLHNK